MRLIDADALKETIASNVYPVADCFNSRDYGMFWTGGIEKAIDEQPTIEPQPAQQWIPCSERLPQKDEQVLCCNKRGSVYTSAYTYTDSRGVAVFGQHLDVIAWMPLPESYSGE